MFGPNVGFIVGEITVPSVPTPDGKIPNLPGYFVIRGDAVAILVVVNGQYILGVEQSRVPVAGLVREAIAGMMDESGNPVGQMVKELKEEASISVKGSDLLYLGEYYSSQGLLDEKIICYAVEISIPQIQLKALLDKLHGNYKHGEAIRLFITPVNDFEAIYETKDAKLIYCYSRYIGTPSKRQSRGASGSSSPPSQAKVKFVNNDGNGNTTPVAASASSRTLTPQPRTGYLDVLFGWFGFTRVTQEIA